MKLYLASDIKGMCIDYDLEDLSPSSVVRRPDGFSLRNMIEEVWADSEKTEYLGEHYMNLEGDEDYKPHHVYKNGQSFLELEKDLKESTVGAVTYYFFN